LFRFSVRLVVVDGIECTSDRSIDRSGRVDESRDKSKEKCVFAAGAISLSVAFLDRERQSVDRLLFESWKVRNDDVGPFGSSMLVVDFLH
jgi:hypothetical protein